MSSNPMTRRTGKAQAPITSASDTQLHVRNEDPKLTFRIDKQLRQDLKAHVAQHDTSIQELLTRLITEYLEKHP